jgi:raffinose/stachyose/melibiose transport system substrate-binding protein
MDTAEAFIPWWDNVFPASSADTHKNLIAQLLAGEITPEQFAERMAQLEPTELHL